MPELPEVETVRRLLEPDVVGRRVVGVRIGWPRTVGGPAASKSFRTRVVGRTITRTWRRGKFLVIDLAKDDVPAGHLVAHLRMSGRMHVEPAAGDPGPWCRLALALDDGRELRFVDPRKFGRVLWCADAGEILGELGPEPFDAILDDGEFARRLRARRGALKPLLLDQGFLAGLGNIYVDEALFRARLHPRATAERVPRERADALLDAIRTTLATAIERQGSSFDTFYRTPEGKPGSYQHEFQVYGRTGRPCVVCGTAIRRLVVGQRGTHVCPRCQPTPRRRAARTE